MQSVTLIIDKRPEMSVKYKKLLDSETNHVIISKDFITSIKVIKDLEPDLIIISDSIEDDLTNFCEEVRALTCNMRPVIVATSKSADFNDRINVLNSGADDFLSEPVNPKEFQVRMRAHLRREYESNLEPKQFLPNKNYTLRAIKRTIIEEKLWAMLYIRIENFEEYKQAYTELASDKLLQTYGAIIKASLSETDYIGLLNENTFLIITDVLKAESVAKFLTYAFDSTISKFYSQQDFSRGYMILQGDEFAGKRADFAHFTISVITNENKKYSDSVEVLNTLEQLNNMANIPVKSNYLIDRIKISGAITEKEYNNKVLIYETDEALSLLLNTILNLQGYKTEIMEEFCLPKEYSEPALIIIDAGDLEKKNGLNLCYKLKQTQKYQNTKMIVTSIIHDKELILNTGADLYLPKPYEIPNLIKWVDTLVREFNR